MPKLRFPALRVSSRERARERSLSYRDRPLAFIVRLFNNKTIGRSVFSGIPGRRKFERARRAARIGGTARTRATRDTNFRFN